MTDSTISPGLRWTVVVLAALVWFGLLGHRDLMGPDEGRYAEIPLQMVNSGDWLTPRLNGLKYFEKPVLQYWLTAASFELFGVSNASARLPVALASFLGALWAMFVAGRLWGRDSGFYVFLILISSFFYSALGHVITLDMLVGVFLFLGVGSLLIAQSDRSDPQQVRNWMLLGWAALALATLTKGLIGLVLPGGAILLYSLWQRDWALWRHLYLGQGLLLYLLIAGPWFIAVSLVNPEFPEFFFIHEHFARYTSNVHERDQAVWYFLPILLAGLMPWLATGLRALARPGFSWRPERPGEFDALRFLWVYALFILLFFSAGSSMLAGYILPMFPPLALIMGWRLARLPRIGIDAWLLPLLGVGLLVAGMALIPLLGDRFEPAALARFRPWLLLAGAVLMISFLWLRRLGATGPRAVAVMALGFLLAGQLLMRGFQPLGQLRSSRTLVETIRPYVEAGAPVYAVAFFPRTLPFYLGRPVRLAITPSELQLGIDQEPEKWIADWPQFVQSWQQPGQAVAVFKTRDFPDFSTRELSFRIIYRDSRKLAVIKP